MFNIQYRTDGQPIDTVTGRYAENTSARKINRASGAYLQASITRLEVIADRRLKDKQAICQALLQYGYALPQEQREALEDYCG